MRNASTPDVPCILILGTAEWDSPIATNQHYVARELARMGEVSFVESLGLRRPKLRVDDISRMSARLRRAFGRKAAETSEAAGSVQGHARAVPERTKIISPIVVPVHRAPTRSLNRTLLRRATSRWLGSPRPRVLWTFTPVTYGLERAADVVIYHCVDLLGSVPGVDAKAVAWGERSLAPKVAAAIATSTVVAEHLEASGFRNVLMLPNVADVSVFASASRPSADRRPAAIFAGNLAAHKLDVPLLRSVANTLRGKGELLIAGPVAPGFGDELRRLEEMGARYLGMLSQQELAKSAGECSVGLIPYAINDYTRGVSPLKCFEYLSSGLSVLSTGLPSVVDVAAGNPHVTVAGAAQTPALLLDSIQPAADEVIEHRIEWASSFGWNSRGQVLRDLLASRLSGRVVADQA